MISNINTQVLKVNEYLLQIYSQLIKIISGNRMKSLKEYKLTSSQAICIGAEDYCLIKLWEPLKLTALRIVGFNLFYFMRCFYFDIT